MNSIFCWPGWNAFVAIGTLVLAGVTFYSLWQLRRSQQGSFNREIAEKVYKPLIDSLQKGMTKVEGFKPFPPWTWNKVKKELIANRLSSSLWDDLENFSKEVLKYNSKRGWKILAGKVNKEIKAHKPEYNESSEVYYSLWIGGEFNQIPFCDQITFYKLIFWDKTLSEYLMEIKEKLGFSPVEEGVSVGHQFKEDWTKEEFEKILRSIKAKIVEDPDLQKFIEETRAFYERAKALKEKLENRLKSLKFA